jgi:Mediator complex subunit 23
VGTVILSLKDVREKNWALTDQYQMYLKSDDTTSSSLASNVVKWNPDLTYYMGLVTRLIESNLISLYIASFNLISFFLQPSKGKMSFLM